MMSKDSLIKGASVLIAIVLLVAAFVFVLGDPEGPNVLGGEHSEVQFAEVDLLTERLNDIAVINIDDTVFEDPVFMSLKNYDEVVYEYGQGRPNPFEPLNPSDTAVERGTVSADVGEKREEGEVIVIGLPSE